MYTKTKGKEKANKVRRKKGNNYKGEERTVLRKTRILLGTGNNRPNTRKRSGKVRRMGKYRGTAKEKGKVRS